MCGGAIISDFIPAAAAAAKRSRRVTADILWPNMRNPSSAGKKFSKLLRPEAVVLDDDFEADFREFKDDSDIDEDDDDELLNGVKGFCVAPTKPFNQNPKSLSRGIYF